MTSRWSWVARHFGSNPARRSRHRRLPRSFRIEDLEDRRVLDATGVGSNQQSPRLDLSAIPAQTATAGTAFTLNLLTLGTVTDRNDDNTPTNNIITFSLDPDVDDTPAGATISAAGVFSWTPTSAQVGSHTIVVLAVDAGNPPLADAETFVVNVVASSSAPVVDLNGSGTGTGFTATFTEDSGGVLAVDTDLTVTASGNLNSATVRITNFTVGTPESLSVTTTGTPITASAFNTSNGTLTLTGQATAAQYQQVLRTLRYNNTSQNPSTTARTVEVIVTSGSGASAVNSVPAISTINVTAIDDAPNLASISNQQSQVGQTFELTVTATDAENNSFTFTLDRDDPGTNIPASATITQNGNSAIIRWVVDQAGIFNFVVLVTQTTGGLADREEFTLTTTSAAPVVDLNGSDGTGTGFTATFTEDGGAVVIVDSDASITDDNSTQLSSATITLQNRPNGPAEVLSVTAVAGTTATYDPNTGVLTITGTASLADYQTMLRSLRYNNASQDPDTADRTVRIVVNDGANASTAVDATVVVVAVADAPTLLIPSEFTNPAAPRTVTAGTPISFVATASDPESPSSDLILSLDLTGSGILATDPQPTITSPPAAVPGGSFEWTPTGLGAFSFDVLVRDPGGETTRVKIFITVEAARAARGIPALNASEESDSSQLASVLPSANRFSWDPGADEGDDSESSSAEAADRWASDCRNITTSFATDLERTQKRLESFWQQVDESFEEWADGALIGSFFEENPAAVC